MKAKVNLVNGNKVFIMWHTLIILKFSLLRIIVHCTGCYNESFEFQIALSHLLIRLIIHVPTFVSITFNVQLRVYCTVLSFS